MSALKPAPLTSALLTRKGMASPSAAPPSRANMVQSKQPRSLQPQSPRPQSPRPQSPRPQSPRPLAVPSLLERPAPYPTVAKSPDWIAPKSGGRGTAENASRSRRSPERRIRMSLRMDMDRHIRLKLVATQQNRTLQSVFIQAIDEFFERHTPDTLDAVSLLRIRDHEQAGGNERARKARGGRGGEH